MVESLAYGIEPYRLVPYNMRELAYYRSGQGDYLSAIRHCHLLWDTIALHCIASYRNACMNPIDQLIS